MKYDICYGKEGIYVEAIQNRVSIVVVYISTPTIRILVRPILPAPSKGHQALKNQDFVDHEYLHTAYAYYNQVTKRNILEKYGVKIASHSVVDSFPQDSL